MEHQFGKCKSRLRQEGRPLLSGLQQPDIRNRRQRTNQDPERRLEVQRRRRVGPGDSIRSLLPEVQTRQFRAPGIYLGCGRRGRSRQLQQWSLEVGRRSVVGESQQECSVRGKNQFCGPLLQRGDTAGRWQGNRSAEWRVAFWWWRDLDFGQGERIFPGPGGPCPGRVEWCFVNHRGFRQLGSVEWHIEITGRQGLGQSEHGEYFAAEGDILCGSF